MNLGLIIPSVNVVIERDLRRFLPSGIEANVTRIPLTDSTPQALARALAAAPAAGRLLADAGVAALALACTGASMLSAPGEPTAAARLTEATGLPAIDTMGAIFDAFAALGARRVTMVSPFGAAFNAAECAALSRGGVTVLRTHAFALPDPAECPTLSPTDIIAAALAIDHPDAEAIFLTCANMRGQDAVAELEQQCGKPVVTSNQAVLWRLLRLAGSTACPTDGGMLFHQQTEPAQ